MKIQDLSRFDLENVSFEILSDSFDKKAQLKEFKNKGFEFINSAKNPAVRAVPIRLTKEEIQRAYKYQKMMLNFVLRRYQASIGTNREETMKKLYNDALIDYNDFISMYKKEL